MLSFSLPTITKSVPLSDGVSVTIHQLPLFFTEQLLAAYPRPDGDATVYNLRAACIELAEALQEAALVSKRPAWGAGADAWAAYGVACVEAFSEAGLSAGHVLRLREAIQGLERRQMEALDSVGNSSAADRDE